MDRNIELFTFTFICLPGKTHNLRSRGDTSRRAQTKHKKHTNIECVNEEGRILWKKITAMKYNYSTQFTLLEVSSSLDKFYVVSPAVLVPTGAGDQPTIGRLEHFSPLARGGSSSLTGAYRMCSGSQLLT